MKLKNTLRILSPLLALFITLIGKQFNLSLAESACLGITVWTGLWWMFEVTHFYITSLIPIVFFPLLNIITAKQAASQLGHPLILLLLGGFIISAAIEKNQLHRRFSYSMISLLGGSNATPRRIVIAFMLTTTILSMWISNTATALALLPVAIAIIKEAKVPKLEIAILLGLAYAANVGGMGTPIATLPNLEFLAQFDIATEGTSFERTYTFIEWMTFGLPLSLGLCLLIGFFLTKNLPKKPLNHEFEKPKKWTTAEKRVAIIFFFTIILWITRQIAYEDTLIGWGPWIESLWGHEGKQSLFHDYTVALLAIILMFSISKYKKSEKVSEKEKSERLLDWETVQKSPWGICLLMAGGLTLSVGFRESGLTQTLGQSFNQFTALPLFVVILIICVSVTFLTELTSNTATTALLMPILAAIGLQANIPPQLLMLPAAISASCAFAMPVATTTNMIIYSTNKIPFKTMFKTGITLNIICAPIIALWLWWVL